MPMDERTGIESDDWGDSTAIDSLLGSYTIYAEVLRPLIEAVRQIRHAIAAMPPGMEAAATDLAKQFLKETSAAARASDLPALKAVLSRYLSAFKNLAGN
jgi:hypothetical protein